MEEITHFTPSLPFLVSLLSFLPLLLSACLSLPISLSLWRWWRWGGERHRVRVVVGPCDGRLHAGAVTRPVSAHLTLSIPVAPTWPSVPLSRPLRRQVLLSSPPPSLPSAVVAGRSDVPTHAFTTTGGRPPSSPPPLLLLTSSLPQLHHTTVTINPMTLINTLLEEVMNLVLF